MSSKHQGGLLITTLHQFLKDHIAFLCMMGFNWSGIYHQSSNCFMKTLCTSINISPSLNKLTLSGGLWCRIFPALSEYLLQTLASELTSDGGSNGNLSPRNWDKWSIWLNGAFDWSFGLQLPRSRHTIPTWIPVSKVDILAALSLRETQVQTLHQVYQPSDLCTSVQERQCQTVCQVGQGSGLCTYVATNHNTRIIAFEASIEGDVG